MKEVPSIFQFHPIRWMLHCLCYGFHFLWSEYPAWLLIFWCSRCAWLIVLLPSFFYFCIWIMIIHGKPVERVPVYEWLCVCNVPYYSSIHQHLSQCHCFFPRWCFYIFHHPIHTFTSFFGFYIFIFVYLYIYVFVYLCICIFVYLCICIFMYLYLYIDIYYLRMHT